MSGLGFGFGSALSTFGVSPVTSPHMSWNGPLAETMGVDPGAVNHLRSPQYATDTLGINPLIADYRAFYKTATETVGVQQLETILRGIVLRERLGLRDSGTPNQRSSVGFSDSLRLAEALLTGTPVVAQETVAVAAALVAQQAAVLIETLGLAETLTGPGAYKRSLSETLRLTTSLANFFGAFAAETLQVEDARVVQKLADGSITETVVTSDTLAPQLLVRVVAQEGVGIDDVDALRLIYKPLLVEGLELSVGYLSPGESFTTWAVNTRSGAVSEYSDYTFNSFARVGNKYLGASDSGLYELIGDTDAGDPIVSVLKGAFLQFGGTHLSRLKEAYIAVTGDEDVFVLKIETLDGASYTYQVDTRSGRSTKIHMGKGQRARYFAYTLTSAGQDFTLDTLEFVPIVVQRRV